MVVFSRCQTVNFSLSITGFQVPVQVQDVVLLEPQGMVGRLLMKHFKTTETQGSVSLSCAATVLRRHLQLAEGQV